jgi:hypothetical protein
MVIKKITTVMMIVTKTRIETDMNHLARFIGRDQHTELPGSHEGDNDAESPKRKYSGDDA